MIEKKGLQYFFCYPQLVKQLELAISLTSNLLVIVVPNEVVVREITKRCLSDYSMHYVDISLALSKGLLDVALKQRSQTAIELLRYLVENRAKKAVFLDNLGVLFDSSLSLSPLKLLQELSRQNNIVVVWRGRIIDTKWLQYADSSHIEYCQEMIESNFTVVDCCHEI